MCVAPTNSETARLLACRISATDWKVPPPRVVKFGTHFVKNTNKVTRHVLVVGPRWGSKSGIGHKSNQARDDTDDTDGTNAIDGADGTGGTDGTGVLLSTTEQTAWAANAGPYVYLRTTATNLEVLAHNANA